LRGQPPDFDQPLFDLSQGLEVCRERSRRFRADGGRLQFSAFVRRWAGPAGGIEDGRGPQLSVQQDLGGLNLGAWPQRGRGQEVLGQLWRGQQSLQALFELGRQLKLVLGSLYALFSVTYANPQGGKLRCRGRPFSA
jgi:hypothetical protein